MTEFAGNYEGPLYARHPYLVQRDEGFDEWFYEMEGYHFRAERFWDDIAYQDKDTILEWLKTAYRVGYEDGQKLYGGTK